MQSVVPFCAALCLHPSKRDEQTNSLCSFAYISVIKQDSGNRETAWRMRVNPKTKLQPSVVPSRDRTLSWYRVTIEGQTRKSCTYPACILQDGGDDCIENWSYAMILRIYTQHTKRKHVYLRPTDWYKLVSVWWDVDSS